MRLIRICNASEMHPRIPFVAADPSHVARNALAQLGFSGFALAAALALLLFSPICAAIAAVGQARRGRAAAPRGRR
jgi:hypothetical protein